MKKMRKLFAMLLALTMILSMTVTAFAANGQAESTDTGVIKIYGLDDAPTVTLYRIAKANYGLDTNGDNVLEGLVDYTWATGVTPITEIKATTANDIATIANGILAGTITPLEFDVNDVNDGKIESNTYTRTVHAGAYIAIITGSNTGAVYNPILLTASYDEDGDLVVGEITVPTVYGQSAVAKKTNPSVNKEITSGTTDDAGKDTAGVGSKVDFQLTPVMPSYPADAKNKTFFVKDTMSTGLTFDFATLNITIGETTLTKEAGTFTDKTDATKTYDVVNYKLGETVVGIAYNTGNGFNINFDYDALIGENGAVNTPIITYSAIVNEKAVAGNPGNPNLAEIFYTNTPNQGEEWDVPYNTPQEGNGIVRKYDEEVVYTYQLSFLKTGEGDDADGLAGAVFGIYADEACTQLIDKVTTNENGYAVSTNVKVGTYYIKELVAPTGYSLNTTVYPITANWTTATTKDTATVTESKYTSVKPNESAEQVGWLKDNVFYEMDEFTADKVDGEGNVTEEGTATKVGAVPAYLVSTTTTTTSSSTITENTAGGGTVGLEKDIPNTKMSALPSTGGIGTTIFTVVGCLTMIAAAFFFFASRRKEMK